MNQSEAARELGIPDDAAVYSGTNSLLEGWEMEWIGTRITNPPSRPWAWPYLVIRRGAKVWMVVQLWRRTVLRPGFAYSVLWHPENGRRYIADARNPEDLPRLLKEAQQVMRRETRGRKRKRPEYEQFLADRARIRHANGGLEPSAGRMADEYDVKGSTVKRWLQRPDWARSRQDK